MKLDSTEDDERRQNRQERIASVEASRPEMPEDIHYEEDKDRIPTLVMVFLGIDLGMATLQLIMFVISLIGLGFIVFSMNQQNGVSQEYIVFTSIGMVLTLLISLSGIIAGVMLFLKKKMGLYFGVASLIFILLSILSQIVSVFFWKEMQINFAQQQAPAQQMEMVMWVSIASAIFGIIIRLAINAPYVWALVQMNKFFNKRDYLT